MKLWERYRAAIFDLDGTLADSMSVWDSLCREWMRKRGLTPPDDLEQTIAVMTLDQSSRYISDNYLPETPPKEIFGEWNALVAEKYGSLKPKPGALRLLHLLRDHGIPMGLATSCFPQACRSFLSVNGMEPLFQAIVYSDEVMRDKTHPDIYLECARRMGVEPAGCVVFEDVEAALAGVHGAGMEMIAVYDESCASWESWRDKADHSVKSLEELTDSE